MHGPKAEESGNELIRGSIRNSIDKMPIYCYQYPEFREAKMSLETVHVKFDRSGEHYDLTFQEQAAPTKESVQINGRQFVILGDPDQRSFFEGVVSGLSPDNNMLPGQLRGRLSDDPQIKNLSVVSSLSLDDQAGRVQTYLRKMEQEKGFSGSVLVKKNGERLVFQGYGVSDAAGTPNSEKTRFWICSLTKQFTGVAIMLLVQEGSLSLDDEINTVLPARFRNKRWNGITLRQLLTHSTGISNYGADPGDEDRERVFTVDEIIAQFSDKDLNFNPGGMFEYSNANYALLGAIIEELSGQSYEEFMCERIFFRRGVDMRATGLFSSYAAAPPASVFYLGPDGKQKSADHREMPIHISKAFAAGAIISTLEDMERWDQALYDDSFLTPASRKEIASAEAKIIFDPDHKSYNRDAQRRAVPKEDEEYRQSYYGFGVGVQGNGEVLLHGGGFPCRLRIIYHSKYQYKRLCDCTRK